MDAKGRLAIPTRVRESIVDISAGRVVVTANTEERCLLVYPETQWLQILPKIEALPSFNKVSRRAQRLLIGYATPLEMDSSGRIHLSSTLRDYAQLDKKVMLVGQGKKLELWSESVWFDWLEDGDADDDVPPEMQNLSL